MELRHALRRIQTELGITTIFVTHDQEEAFELGDRLGVMNFGRLLEVGTPAELYQHPQTEFVASFLGTANLLVGESIPGGVQIGPLSFPLDADSRRIEKAAGAPRVQALFRPEDVSLALEEEALDAPQLGMGEIRQNIFSGSVERLRVSMPAIPGVRPIAPPLSYGDDAIAIEVTRTQDVARRYPLETGSKVRVGVRRIHTLVHPGLSFLILTDGSEAARAAVDLGGQIARLAHARVTILNHGQQADAYQDTLQAVKESLGSGLAQLEVRSTAEQVATAVAHEVERQPYDLIVFGCGALSPANRAGLAEQILRSGDHHLLLVPAAHAEPAHALVCVTGGEPGKEDVLFAGRFLRHLGAQTTLLTVLFAGGADNLDLLDRVERFQAGGVRTLELLGVPARAAIRLGKPVEEITRQVATGGHDLLVVGAPLTQKKGEVSLQGVTSQIIQEINTLPLLIVRSRYAAALVPPLTNDGRINIVEEIIP